MNVVVRFDKRPEYNVMRVLIPNPQAAVESGITLDALIVREIERHVIPFVGNDYWVIDSENVPDSSVIANAAALKAYAVKQGWGS
tara:strand:+ start:479 stop:733 length:255 start_codon:yes stop_codon:yes gene_type:complete